MDSTMLPDYLNYRADLDAHSQAAGALHLTVPMLYLEARK